MQIFLHNRKMRSCILSMMFVFSYASNIVINWQLGGTVTSPPEYAGLTSATMTTADTVSLIWSNNHNLHIASVACPGNEATFTQSNGYTQIYAGHPGFNPVVIPQSNFPSAGTYCIACLASGHYGSMHFTITVNQATSSGGSGDPHLYLGNGGRTDFRGLNDTYFNFISSPSFNLNVKTEMADFTLNNKHLLVHGSFMTEAHVTTPSSKVSLIGSKIGSANIIFVNGTCEGQPFKIGAHRKYPCGSLTIVTDYASARITTDDWYVHMQTNPVYDRIQGPKTRIDLNIDKRSVTNSHGILGHSYYLDEGVDGEIDVYPTKVNLRRARWQAVY